MRCDRIFELSDSVRYVYIFFIAFLVLIFFFFFFISIFLCHSHISRFVYNLHFLLFSFYILYLTIHNSFRYSRRIPLPFRLFFFHCRRSILFSFHLSFFFLYIICLGLLCPYHLIIRISSSSFFCITNIIFLLLLLPYQHYHSFCSFYFLLRP